MYKYYGDNVKKCDNSENPEKRTLQYTTGYIEPCKIIKISEKYIDKCFAENYISNVQLRTAFKNWFTEKYNGEKIPSSRAFINGIKKHKIIEKTVWVDEHNTTGIKHLSLKNYFL